MQESNVRRECVLLTDTVLDICKAKSVKQITLIYERDALNRKKNLPDWLEALLPIINI